MKASDILLYNLGHAASIRRVAENPRAKWIGLVLVLTAGIAREYDQVHVLEAPFDFFAPVLVSLAASVLIFLPLKLVLPQENTGTRPLGGYGSFLALFWMTAPLAWLYALPVERWFESTQAVAINVGLLAVVATWRVLILTRAVAVLTGFPYLRVLVAVLAVTSVYVLVVSFPAALANVMTMMSGLRNSPELLRMQEIAQLTNRIAVPVFVVSAVSSVAWRMRRHQPGSAYPTPTSQRVPWRVTSLALLVWFVPILIVQPTVWRTYHTEKLLANERYDEALAYMAKFQPNDFAAARRIPPSPFEWFGARQLIGLMARTDANHPEWLRKHFLSTLETVLNNGEGMWMHLFAEDYGLETLKVLSSYPGGKAWAAQHTTELLRLCETTVRLAPEGDRLPDLQRYWEALGIDPTGGATNDAAR